MNIIPTGIVQAYTRAELEHSKSNVPLKTKRERETLLISLACF